MTGLAQVIGALVAAGVVATVAVLIITRVLQIGDRR